jgi:uncharacterized membrane protein
VPIVSQDGSAAVARGSALPAWLGRLALPLILVIGAALRFAILGHGSFWVDEAYSVDISSRDPFELVRRAAAVDSHPPLYYLLLRGWLSIFGDSEYAVRSLSAVIGVLVIVVVYQLGVAIAGRWLGLSASLLTAVSPFYVRYSGEARMYMLAALLTGASFLFLIRLLEERSRRDSVLYVLATTLLLYTHVYGLFVLLAQVIIVLARLRSDSASRRQELRSWARLLGVTVLLYSPWLVAIAKQARDELRGEENTNIGWLDTPHPDDILDTLITYAGSGIGLVVMAVVCLGAVLVGLRATAGPRPPVRRALRDAFGGTHAPLLGIWFVTPIVVPFIVSVAILPIYLTKYTMPASVAFYLLVATAIHRLGRNVVGAAVLACVAALLLTETISHLRTFTPSRWQAAIEYLEEQARPGEVVFFDGSFIINTTLAHYSRRDDLVAKETDEQLDSTPQRVWVVQARDDDPALRARLASLGYVERSSKHFEGSVETIDVRLFEHPA